MAQESMFWKLVPEDVTDTPAEFTNVNSGFLWRVKKDNMEVASGKNLDKERMGSKNVAVERLHTKGILGNIRG